MKLVLASIVVFASAMAQAEVKFAQCNPQTANQTRRVTISSEDRLQVVAAGNPTTGYRWVSHQGLEPIYDSSNTAIGSGGVFTFNIGAGVFREGKSELTFSYKRAWESGAISKCKVIITKE